MAEDRVATVPTACTGKPLRRAVTKLPASIRVDELRRARHRLDHARHLPHAIPAMQEEAAALIAGLMFAAE
jgi:hypothetical protein